MNTPDFKILLTDAHTQPLVEQLVSSEQLQRVNVCLVLQLKQAEKQLRQLLEQDLTRVVCILDPSSCPALTDTLNQLYSFLPSFQILFTAAPAMEPTTLIPLEAPAGFRVLQANLEVAFSTQQSFFAKSLPQLFGFVQNAISGFRELGQPAKVSLIGREFTDFKALQAKLPKFEGPAEPVHLILIDREAFRESKICPSLVYGALLREFQHIVEYVIAAGGEQATIDLAVANIEQLVTAQQPAAELNRILGKQLQPEALRLHLDECASQGFLEAVAAVAAQVKALATEEKQILKQADVGKLRQFNERKKRADQHVVAQRLVMKFMQSCDYRNYVLAMQEMRRNAAMQGKALEAAAQVKLRFLRERFYAMFCLTQENSEQFAEQLRRALQVAPAEKFEKYVELFRTTQGVTQKLMNMVKSGDQVPLCEAFGKQPVRRSDPQTKIVFDNGAQNLRRIVVIDGEIGFGEEWELGEVGFVKE